MEPKVPHTAATLYLFHLNDPIVWWNRKTIYESARNKHEVDVLFVGFPKFRGWSLSEWEKGQPGC